MHDAQEKIVHIFNALIAHAPAGAFPNPVRLVVDDKTAKAGRTEKRAMACTDGDSVYIVRALCDASDARMTGVLAHELAHVSLLQHGMEEHTEREADAEAEVLFGINVGYDAHDIQTTDQHATRPRPKHLDSRGSNRKSVRENPSNSRRVSIEDVATYRANPSPLANAVFDWELPGTRGVREVAVDDVTIVYGYDGKSAHVASVRTKVKAQGQGKARRVLELFCAEADALGIPIKLEASPLTKRVSLSRLVAFYKSLGFEKTGRKINFVGDSEMVRLPHATYRANPRRFSIEDVATAPVGTLIKSRDGTRAWPAERLLKPNATPAPRRNPRREWQRGDVMKIGKTQWILQRAEPGASSFWAYKWPSKKNKSYAILCFDDRCTVHEIGGSAQRISDDVASGLPVFVEHLEDESW